MTPTLPPIDVVQRRLSEGRCILCGHQNLRADPKTGFPEQVCVVCQDAQRRARRAARES